MESEVGMLNDGVPVTTELGTVTGVVTVTKLTNEVVNVKGQTVVETATTEVTTAVD